MVIETGRQVFDEDTCIQHEGLKPGVYALLTVSDNGSGMDEEVRRHLFEPFFTTKGMGQGTGLGLATVYGIVKQNQGFLTVESAPGQGSTFRIFLPWCAGGESTRIGDSNDAVAPPLPAARGGETLLVVEDEPAILRMMTLILGRLGYRVLFAESARAAMGVAEGFSGAIDLLITDVIMPGQNGQELLTNLRRTRSELPCLFVSGYAPEVIQGHLREGACFLQKPFSREELARTIRRVLDRV